MATANADDTVEAGTGGAVDQLKAMFPDFDTEVLSSVLAIHERNVEMAVHQCLEMQCSTSGVMHGDAPNGTSPR